MELRASINCVYLLRYGVAMRCGIWLKDLGASAMAMQVPETTEVHQNVELKGLPTCKRATHLVVQTAMPKS
jgi:hypothetical protein